jgi:translation elongation factor EF-4
LITAYLHPLGPEEGHQWQKDNVLPKQVHVTNYEENSPTIINDGISNDSVDKQSSGSKFSSFGPTSFSGVYNVKDYQTGTFATSLMRVYTLDLKFSLEREVLSASGTGEPSTTV